MKKATKLKHWLFELIAGWMPDERPNPKKNEVEIMNLLLFSNFHPLTTKESIEIFKTVEAKFIKIIAERKINCKDELTSINNFDGTNVFKIDVKDKAFDIPVHNVEFVNKTVI